MHDTPLHRFVTAPGSQQAEPTARMPSALERYVREKSGAQLTESTAGTSGGLRSIAGSPFTPFAPALEVRDLPADQGDIASRFYSALTNRWRENLGHFGAIDSLPPQLFETAEYKSAILQARYEVAKDLPHAEQIIREKIRRSIEQLSERELLAYKSEGTHYHAPVVARDINDVRAKFGNFIQSDVDQLLANGAALHLERGSARGALGFLKTFELQGPIPDAARAKFPQFLSRLLDLDGVKTFAELKLWLEFKLAEASRSVNFKFTATEGLVSQSGFDREPTPPGRVGLISEGIVRDPRETERDLDR